MMYHDPWILSSGGGTRAVPRRSKKYENKSAIKGLFWLFCSAVQTPFEYHHEDVVFHYFVSTEGSAT